MTFHEKPLLTKTLATIEQLKTCPVGSGFMVTSDQLEDSSYNPHTFCQAIFSAVHGQVALKIVQPEDTDNLIIMLDTDQAGENSNDN